MFESSLKRRLPGMALAVVTCVSAVALAAGGAVAASKESQEYFKDAQEYLKGGDYRSAVIQLKNAVRADPDNAAARHALGVAYLRTGDAVSAEKELNAAQQRGFPEDKVASPLAQALLMQGRPEELLKRVPRGQRAAEIEGEVLIWHGYAHGALGDLDAAHGAFEEAARLRPSDGRPLMGLGQMLIERRDVAGAAQAAERAVAAARSPDQRADALALKGEVSRLSGDAAGARALFDEALMADSGNRTALIGRATVAIAEGKPEDAKKDLKTALEISPGHAVATYLTAVIQANEKKFEAALDSLRGPSLQKYPPALFLLASVHFTRNELEQAISALDRYMGAAGRDLRSQKLLGSILLRQRRTDAAIPVLRAAAEADSKDPQLRALLAAAYMQQGDNASAAEWLDKAMEISPKDTDTLTRFALGQMQLGDNDDAVATLRSAAESDPEAMQTRMLLVLAHLRGGSYDEALQVADEMARKMPDSPLPHNLAGGALMAKKDLAGARAAFERALANQANFTPALLNLARLEVQEGNVDVARNRFRQAIEADPKNMQAMLGLAELEQAQANADAALDWLRRAVEAQPQQAAPRLRLVGLLLQRNEPEKAVAAAREGLQVVPGNPGLLEALGRAQWAAGDRANAAASFRQLAASNPRSAPAQAELGRVMLAQGDEAAAVQALQRAVAVDDAYLPAHVELIGIAVRAGRNDEAIGLAQGWSRRHPDSVEGAVLVADLMQRFGHFDEALAVLKAVPEAKTAAPLVMRVAELQVRSGKPDEALAVLKEWADAGPQIGARRVALGNMHLRLKQYDQAQAVFEAVLPSEGDNPTVLNNLAWLYDRKGDPRATGMAEKAYRLAPNSPEIADTLGFILVRGNDLQRGLALLSDAHEKRKDAPEIRYHLAVALQAAGRKDEARKLLEGLVTEKAEFEEASAALALHQQLSR